MNQDDGRLYIPNDIDMSEMEREEFEQHVDRMLAVDAEEVKQLKPIPPAARPAALRRLRKNGNRNKPCPCLSGKKFKNCCFNKSEQELNEMLNKLLEDTMYHG